MGLRGPPRCEGLTPKQREILARVANGESVKMIARAEDLGVGTVQKYMKHIRERLAVRNAPQAVAVAIRNGWI